MQRNLIQPRLILWAAIALAAAVGCTPPNEYQPPPPPPVTVANPVVQTVTNYIDETGTTEAVDFVEIRARVKGFLQKVNFQPNDAVKKGDVLYQIDPREYEARVNEHQAAVEVANARYLEAEARLKRGEQAYKGGAITAEEYGERRAAREVTRAEIAAEKAGLNEALLQLSFTKVTSPIDGMVGKTLVYEGNLVGDNEATHLATVVKYDPIYATFSISERALLDIMKTRGPRSVERPDRADIKIYLRRANDEGYPFEGRLEYTDLAVDESTGTYSIRGVFPNPELRIVPGLFVQVRVPIGVTEGATLVPLRALGTDQRGKYLLVVNNQDLVERRDVQVGSQQGEMVIVAGNIKPEDRVIVDGLQRAREGDKVTITKSEPSQPAAASVGQPSETPAAQQAVPPPAADAAKEKQAPAPSPKQQ